MAATIGFGNALDAVEHRLAVARELLGRRRVADGLHHLDLRAGDEAVGLPAREDERLHRGVPLEPVEELDELEHQLGVDRVHPLARDRRRGASRRRRRSRRGSGGQPPRVASARHHGRLLAHARSHSRSRTSAAPSAPAAHTVRSACCPLRRSELAQRLEDHPRAGGGERVAERDRAAVHVELRGIDLAERLLAPELLLGERLRGERLEVREHLGGERLVHVDEVHVARAAGRRGRARRARRRRAPAAAGPSGRAPRTRTPSRTRAAGSRAPSPSPRS